MTEDPPTPNDIESELEQLNQKETVIAVLGMISEARAYQAKQLKTWALQLENGLIVPAQFFEEFSEQAENFPKMAESIREEMENRDERYSEGE